ncbi:unnamed protein product [Amoebophrya sp. A120]|nr:unnamed protein product [Amoebophrya sp. A120]|eukprot:GSA120T00024428001.1
MTSLRCLGKFDQEEGPRVLFSRVEQTGDSFEHDVLVFITSTEMFGFFPSIQKRRFVCVQLQEDMTAPALTGCPSRNLQNAGYALWQAVYFLRGCTRPA